MIDCNALALGRKVTIHINNYTIAETPNPHPPGDLNIDDQLTLIKVQKVSERVKQNNNERRKAIAEKWFH